MESIYLKFKLNDLYDLKFFIGYNYYSAYLWYTFIICLRS